MKQAVPLSFGRAMAAFGAPRPRVRVQRLARLGRRDARRREGRRRGQGSTSKSSCSRSTRFPTASRSSFREDHQLPIVGVNIWYHTGPMNEPGGQTGFAHLFEASHVSVFGTRA